MAYEVKNTQSLALHANAITTSLFSRHLERTGTATVPGGASPAAVSAEGRAG